VRVFSLLMVGAIFGVPSVLYGDALGLSRPAVIVWAVIGSMIGVTVNVLASDWVADRMRRRANAKGTTSRIDLVSDRAGPIVDRLGTVGLGLVGPILLGTFGTALVGPLIGIPRRRVFFALLVGVIFWCTVFAIASDLLVEQFEIDSNAP
jgi:uncharacterized membrane protein